MVRLKQYFLNSNKDDVIQKCHNYYEENVSRYGCIEDAPATAIWSPIAEFGDAIMLKPNCGWCFRIGNQWFSICAIEFCTRFPQLNFSLCYSHDPTLPVALFVLACTTATDEVLIYIGECTPHYVELPQWKSDFRQYCLDSVQKQGVINHVPYLRHIKEKQPLIIERYILDTVQVYGPHKRKKIKCLKSLWGVS